MHQIERSIEIDVPLQRVFAFVTDIRNHPRVVPPETREQLIDVGEVPLRLGTTIKLRARYGGIYWTLASRITAFDPPTLSHPDRAYFRDEQVSGPFAAWIHDHWFEAVPTANTRLTDRFTYAAPFGPLGRLVERIWLNGRLHRLLDHMQSTEKHFIESEAMLPDTSEASHAHKDSA